MNKANRINLKVIQRIPVKCEIERIKRKRTIFFFTFFTGDAMKDKIYFKEVSRKKKCVLLRLILSILLLKETFRMLIVFYNLEPSTQATIIYDCRFLSCSLRTYLNNMKQSSMCFKRAFIDKMESHLLSLPLIILRMSYESQRHIEFYKYTPDLKHIFSCFYMKIIIKGKIIVEKPKKIVEN